MKINLCQSLLMICAYGQNLDFQQQDIKGSQSYTAEIAVFKEKKRQKPTENQHNMHE